MVPDKSRCRWQRQILIAPFYTSKTRKFGHGLGLSTAFDFAKLNGGKIRIGNTPDGGAIVTIRLPYQKTEAVTSGLVLLVDDTLEIRTTVRRYLREMGYAVVEAANAGEARALSHMPELTHVVTDLDLGDGPDGYFDILQKPFNFAALAMQMQRLSTS